MLDHGRGHRSAATSDARALPGLNTFTLEIVTP